MTRSSKFFLGFALVLFLLFLAWGVRAETRIIQGSDGTTGIVYGDGPTQFTWTTNPTTGESEVGQIQRHTTPSVWTSPSGSGVVYEAPGSTTQFYSKGQTSGIITTPQPPAPACLLPPCAK